MTVCPNAAGLRRGEVAGFGRKIVDVLWEAWSWGFGGSGGRLAAEVVS